MLQLAGQLLVHAEEIANLASAHADVACRHVHVGSDHLEQLGHEGLAEAHDLGIALATRSKVGAALAAAHRQRGERVLERLLEAEELEDREIDRGMETQTALVGADGTVELNAVADVDLHLALVVDPRHAESGDALRLYDALNDLGFLELRVLVVDIFDRFENFSYSLEVLQFARVLSLKGLHDFFNFHSF